MPRNKSRIPKFKSYKEEGEFWDTHSFADYLDEMTPVKLRFIPKSVKRDTLTIRLSSSLKKKIADLAKYHDVSPSSLIRMWIAEKIRELSAVSVSDGK